MDSRALPASACASVPVRCKLGPGPMQQDSPRKKRRSSADPVANEPTRLLRSESAQGWQRQELTALWEAGELCDTVVECDGEEYHVHRIVLAAGSAYVQAMLKSSMCDGGANATRISITDVPGTCFRAVLAHLYRGECHVTSSSLPGTLAAASRLEVASLLRAGAEFLERELTPANAIVTWLLAAELSRPIEFGDLITACQRTVSESFEEATQCDAFPRLRSEHMAALLAPTNPMGATELDLFRAVARWAKGQSPPEAPRTLTELFTLVHLENINAEALVDVVEAEEAFVGLPVAQQLLTAAFKHIALPLQRRGPARKRTSPDARIAWNADDKHKWVRLSEDCLTVGYNGTGDEDDYQQGLNGMVRASRGWQSGRHYFEFTFVLPLDDTGFGFPTIGVVAPDVSLGGDDEYAIGGRHGRGWGYLLDGMCKVHAGEKSEMIDSARIGRVPDGTRFGLQLDMDAGTLELYIDGVLQPESTHTGVRSVGKLYAACEAGTLSRQQLLFNFGAKLDSGAA